MTLNVNLFSRDFSLPLSSGLSARPQTLSWSVYGGPYNALISLVGPLHDLLNSLTYLRCPVLVSDDHASPVWWGLIDRVTLYDEDTIFEVDLEKVFNSVKVTYSFISPDNKLADQLQTSFASDIFSISEYGTRQTVIHRTNIDSDYAEKFRDTFLNTHAAPHTAISQSSKPSKPYAIAHSSGWFQTLAWKAYTNSEGLYANYGPGPGTLNFALSNVRYPSQKFTPASDCSVKYVWFPLRKNNSPTGNLSAKIYSDNAGSPNAVLATSDTVADASLPATSYAWTCFTFATPFALSAGTTYWVSCTNSTTHASNNIFIKTDENASYQQDNHFAKYYNGSAWVSLTNISAPGLNPHLYFRVVCVSDTGEQLSAIATAGNQFFNQIFIDNTNIAISPYRSGDRSCLDEIKDLMHLGTSNQRLILASVSPERNLTFYEQPVQVPTVYLKSDGSFVSSLGIPLKPYFPPVGQWSGFAGTDHIIQPFDAQRAPSCFIAKATYDVQSNRLIIK